MAYLFGDGFDLYATTADMANGYWDSTVGVIGSWGITTGRFAGSQAIVPAQSAGVFKNSGANDAVHHVICAFRTTNAISGTTLGAFFQLSDGATGQCAIVFRSDGAILLTSGTSAGTVLATYTGAVTTINTWYAFECEVVINNTTGSFTVRKNGNTAADFTATGLNTRGGTSNNYANRLTFNMNVNITQQQIDDLFWRSDASSVAWLGDIRCSTRMPAGDVSVQFSRNPSYVQTPFTGVSAISTSSSFSFYTPFVAAYTGTVAAATVSITTGFTGNLKCSVFNDSITAPGSPGTVLASATTLTNPAIGINPIAFGTPFSVVKGRTYWLGFSADGSYSVAVTATSASVGKISTTVGYSTFPAASPAVSNNPTSIVSWTISLAVNNEVVSEAQQDGLTSYVYDSTVNDADFYSVGTIASTPVSTIAVTTRGYMQKSDAGSRTAAVQIKSGSTTVATPTLTLTTSGWQWAWRTDLVDPNTSAAWTAAAVNAVNIGPLVVS